MSATRDQSQKVAFVYSNLYQIYQKGKSAAQNADVAPAEMPSEGDASPVAQAPLAVPKKPVAPAAVHQAAPSFTSGVLKAESGKPAPQVSSYTPAEFIGKRVARPSILSGAPAGAPKHAIMNLKDNLKALNDLHSRLRFMLQELEDLVKE